MSIDRRLLLRPRGGGGRGAVDEKKTRSRSAGAVSKAESATTTSQPLVTISGTGGATGAVGAVAVKAVRSPGQDRTRAMVVRGEGRAAAAEGVLLRQSRIGPSRGAGATTAWRQAHLGNRRRGRPAPVRPRRGKLRRRPRRRPHRDGRQLFRRQAADQGEPQLERARDRRHVERRRRRAPVSGRRYQIAAATGPGRRASMSHCPSRIPIPILGVVRHGEKDPGEYGIA